MTASCDISNAELVALSRTLIGLRCVARQLTASAILHGHSASLQSGENPDVVQRGRAKKAALASLLYLDLRRAAMELVGKRYVDEKMANREGRRVKYIQRKIRLGRASELMTIEVGHVLPLIQKAALLMDDITSLAYATAIGAHTGSRT